MTDWINLGLSILFLIILLPLFPHHYWLEALKSFLLNEPKVIVKDIHTKELLWKIPEVSEGIKDKYLDKVSVFISNKKIVLKWKNKYAALTIENTDKIAHVGVEEIFIGIGIKGCRGQTLFHWYEFKMRNPFFCKHNTAQESFKNGYLRINKDLTCHVDELTLFVRISTYQSPSFYLAENYPGYETSYNDVAEEDESTHESNKGGGDDRLCLITKVLVNLSKNLKYLYLEDKDPDVRIIVRNGNLAAHRSILRARSPVLNAMLKQEMSEIREDEYDSKDFAIFLLFLYSGTVDNLTTDNVISVYNIADKYEVPDLRETCAGYLVSKLTVNSVSNVIRVALKHKDSKLQEYATDFFMKHADKVFSTTEWQSFLTENPTIANELVMKSYSYKSS